VALYAIAAIAVLASLDALAHSYTGLYGWSVHHRLSGWQAVSWPAEIDVFLLVGELALYVAYLDEWPLRQRIWPWVTAIVGLVVSVAGNVGHVEPSLGLAVTLTDRLTAAASPIAAFAGLMIGPLVLKMGRERRPAGEGTSGNAIPGEPSIAPVGLRAVAATPICEDSLLKDAARIVQTARANGEQVTQRMLATQLRGQGHRFSNAQLGAIATEAAEEIEQHAI
jgi:hypothetical protein